MCIKYSKFEVTDSKISSLGDGLSIVLRMVPVEVLANFRAFVKVKGSSMIVEDIERLDSHKDLSKCIDVLEDKASSCVYSDLKLNFGYDPEHEFEAVNKNAQEYKM